MFFFFFIPVIFIKFKLKLEILPKVLLLLFQLNFILFEIAKVHF